jgi:hypothetical protein
MLVILLFLNNNSVDMSTRQPEEALATPERLEHAFEDAKAIGQAKPDSGGPLNAFFGSYEVLNMGQDLITHMRDEERWGEPNANFTPTDFVIAASEVAFDHTAGNRAGDSKTTNIHIPDRQHMKLTFGIFINFWLPRIAKQAYGQEYAEEVRAIIQDTSNM